MATEPDPFAPPTSADEVASDVVVRKTSRRVILIHFLLLPFALGGGYVMSLAMPKNNAEVLAFVAVAIGLVALWLDKTTRAPARLVATASRPLPVLPDAKIEALFGVAPDTASKRLLVLLAIRFQAASVRTSGVVAASILVCEYALRVGDTIVIVVPALFSLGVFLVAIPNRKQLRRAINEASAAKA